MTDPVLCQGGADDQRHRIRELEMIRDLMAITLKRQEERIRDLEKQLERSIAHHNKWVDLWAERVRSERK
jgi:hypothetical protein